MSDLVMVFPAQVRGSETSVMLDSGASCNAISAAAAKRLSLDIQSPTRDPVVVQLADGHVVSHLGRRSLTLSFRTCTLFVCRAWLWTLICLGISC
jgi:Aspartyl protease